MLAERTCETLVLDGFGRIRYRGAIDDQYAQGKSQGQARKDLRQGRPGRHPGQSAHQGDGHPGRRLPAGPRRSQPRRGEQGAARPGAVGRAQRPVRIARSRAAGEGRDGELCLRGLADHPEPLPVVPPAGAGRAVLLAELRRRAEALGDDPRGRRGAADAPLARRPAVRAFRQRPQALGQGARDAARLGRPGHAARRHQGHAAGPQVPRGLDDRQARRRLRDPRDVLRAGAGGGGLRPLRRADELQGGHVDPGRRGGAGRSVGRPPHRRLPAGSIVARPARGGPASTSAAMPRATCPRSCPRARPSGSPPARTC